MTRSESPISTSEATSTDEATPADEATSAVKIRMRQPRPEPQHTYPSHYPPGKHWAIDASWEILDFLPAGALTDSTRTLLAPMIASRLLKERERAALIARRGGNPQIAKAIRHEG
jgi:hypothetical protein